MSAALHVAQIGPNAITQITGALEVELGPDAARRLLRSCGFSRYVDEPPRDMVDEIDVISFHRALRDRLPPSMAACVGSAAGRRTADYLLENRIPGWVRRVLPLLPSALASRLLIAAISRHAWTFSGSARCRLHAGAPVIITMEGCALCCGAHAAAPICHYYTATFERLFGELVHPQSRARETACIATGDRACRFEIDWGG
jgi:divinyl protochlorophyllide a 8-vinyl-reductase